MNNIKADFEGDDLKEGWQIIVPRFLKSLKEAKADVERLPDLNAFQGLWAFICGVERPASKMEEEVEASVDQFSKVSSSQWQVFFLEWKIQRVLMCIYPLPALFFVQVGLMHACISHMI
jgi:hypothetical protein